MECLHGLLASARLLPSTPELAGTRSFEGRGGVYFAPPPRRLAEYTRPSQDSVRGRCLTKPFVEITFPVRVNEMLLLLLLVVVVCGRAWSIRFRSFFVSVSGG